MEKRRKYPTEKSGADYLITAAETAAGLIPEPITSTAIQQLIGLITPPLQRRQENWLMGLGERVEHLEEAVSDIDKDRLAEDPMFVSALVRASQLALGTHQKEKLKALQNAVVNSALPDRPDENLQQMLLNYINDLTVWHIVALKYLPAPDEPKRNYYQEYANEMDKRNLQERLAKISSVAGIHPMPEGFESGFNDNPLETQILLDLHSRGLIEVVEEDLEDQRTIWAQRSRLGQVFFEFISDPELDSDE